jgi:hypothetical protein
MQPSGQNELHLVPTRLNKLMIIFYMNIIFQYFLITLFSSKNNCVTNNSKKITPIYTLCKKYISNLRRPYEFKE